MVVGYHLNLLDKPVFMAGPKHLLTEFGIHQRLESCVAFSTNAQSRFASVVIDGVLGP